MLTLWRHSVTLFVWQSAACCPLFIWRRSADCLWKQPAGGSGEVSLFHSSKNHVANYTSWDSSQLLKSIKPCNLLSLPSQIKSNICDTKRASLFITKSGACTSADPATWPNFEFNHIYVKYDPMRNKSLSTDRVLGFIIKYETAQSFFG